MTREELIAEVQAERRPRVELIDEIGLERRDALRRELDTVLLNNGNIDKFFTQQPELANQPIEGTITGHPEPDIFRAKLANSFYFADAYGMDIETAFDRHDALTERLWGEGVSSISALERIVGAKEKGRQSLRRELTKKTLWQATKDAYSQAGIRMTKSISGFAELAGYLNQKLTPWEVEAFDRQTEWGRQMSEAVEEYYRTHPEEFIQVKGDGFWDTTLNYLENPVAIYQGMLEAVPMMLEVYLGHVTGTAAARYVGAGQKFIPWVSRVQGIAVPVFGEEYAKLRDRDIDPALAIPHAFLVAQGEGLVEEWVISRRFAMFKGVGQIAQKGMGEMVARTLWGGTKAYTRGLTEEAVQSANRNFWEIVFTDSDTKLLDGVAEEGAAGGLIELAMGGVFASAGQVRRTGTQILAPKEDELARIEAVRNLMKTANLTPDQRAEIDKEADKVRTQVENDEYEKPTPREVKAPVVPQNIKQEINEVTLPPEQKVAEVLPPEIMGGIAAERITWTRKGVEVEITRAEAGVELTRLTNELTNSIAQNNATKANANWTEIAGLRAALGYAKGLKPFKVVKPEGKPQKLVKNTKSRIWQAIRPEKRVALTARQMLNYVMKGMEKASRRAYMDGAKTIVKEHKDLARYANQQLKGLDITQAQRKRLLDSVAKTRTTAEKVAAIATIDVLVDKAEHKQAVTNLRKTTRYINKKIGRIMQEKGVRPEYLERIKAVTDTFVFTKPTAKTQKRVASLKGYIDSLREAEMTKYERDFAEELLPKYLTEKLETIETTPVEKMSTDQIKDINIELQRLIRLNDVKNKIILERTAREAAVILNGAVAELDNVIDKSVVPEERTLQTDFQNNSIARQVIGWTATTYNHDMETLIDTITGGQKGAAFEAVVEQFSHGREMRDAYLNKVGDYMQKTMEDNNITLQDLQRMSAGFQRLFKTEKTEAIRKFMAENFGVVATPKFKVKLAGQTISLTKAEIMSIYMHAQARYNTKAMLKEGVASWREKIGKVTIAELERIDEIINADPKAKALCDAAAYVYANISKDAINEMSLDLKGIELADEPNWWHVDRFTAGGIAGAETYRVSQLEREGRIQPRTGSKNPVIIRDFFEAFFNDRQAIGEYVGMAKAYRAAKMLFNYKVYRNKIRGLGYTRELNALGDVIRNTEQHPYDRAPIDSVIMRILRGTVRAVLAEPGIWLGQFTSVNGYFNEASRKYRTFKIMFPPSQKAIDRYKRNWPFIKARDEGGVSSIALQDIAQNDMALRMLTDKVDYMSFFTTMIHWVDIKAIGVAGKITEAEMADTARDERSKEYWNRQPIEPSELEVESEEYWDAFRKRARYLARRTQPMFEGENRSVHTGVTAPAKKMWFMFRSYVDQPLRMAYREHTARQNNRISRSTLIRKMANIWATLSSYAVLQYFVGILLYRKDDDWEDLIFDIMAAPIKILTVVGYPIKVLLERIIDVKRGKRPAFYKPKFDTVAISIANRTIDAATKIADGLGYLGSGERYKSGLHKGELKSHCLLKEGILMQIENIAALFGIPADRVHRIYRGLTKEEKPLALKD